MGKIGEDITEVLVRLFTQLDMTGLFIRPLTVHWVFDIIGEKKPSFQRKLLKGFRGRLHQTGTTFMSILKGQGHLSLLYPLNICQNKVLIRSKTR